MQFNPKVTGKPNELQLTDITLKQIRIYWSTFVIMKCFIKKNMLFAKRKDCTDKEIIAIDQIGLYYSNEDDL